MLFIWRRGDGVEVTILTWSGEIWFTRVSASTLDGWRPETTSGPWSGRLARVRACTGVFASAAAACRAREIKSIFLDALRLCG